MVGDSLAEVVFQSGNRAAVDDVRIMLQIKWDVVRVLSEQDHSLSEGVRVANLVKYVWIAACHVRNNQICFGDLVINPLKDALRKNLLIDPLTISARTFSGGFDAQLIDVAERRIKRHQYKNKRFRRCSC